MPEFRRLYGARARHVHDIALEANRTLCDAREQAEGVGGALGLSIQRHLAKAMAALSDLDRSMLDAGWADGEHCNCGGFPNGLPHRKACPLFDSADVHPADAEVSDG